MKKCIFFLSVYNSIILYFSIKPTLILLKFDIAPDMQSSEIRPIQYQYCLYNDFTLTIFALKCRYTRRSHLKYRQ